MNGKKRGLGKGLDALFLDNEVQSQEKQDTLPLSQVLPNKGQPRQDFDLEALTELAQSIGQHGVLQPLLVRPLPEGQYQIIAGERRWRACRMAGLKEVPVIIQSMTDQKTMEIALIENLQREDLNIVEEALGYKRLIDDYNLTQDEVATSVGKPRPSVANTLRLLQLPDKVLTWIRKGDLSKGHGKVLLSIETEQNQIRIAEEAINHQWTVRQLEQYLKKQEEEKKEEKKGFPKNVFYEEAALSLTEILGTQVNVMEKNNKSAIEIEFFSEEELINIINRLSKI